MAIIATGSKTIIDLSDGKSVSVYLNSNMPKSQIYKTNQASGSKYEPDWTSTHLVISPTVYVNQVAKSITHTGSGNGEVGITWYRRVGGATATAITSGQNGETIGNASSNFALTVSQNTLNPTSNTSNMITYIASIKYKDPDTGAESTIESDITFTLVTMGADVNMIWITGEQVFKSNADGSSITPSSITLTANTSGTVTGLKWQFYNSRIASPDWQTYPGYTAGTNTLTVTPTDKSSNVSVFDANGRLRLKASNTDGSIYDEASVYIVSDGAAGSPGTPGTNGSPASVAFLSNENITLAANNSGVVSATTLTSYVVAYTGTNKVIPTVGTITTSHSSITASAGTAISSSSSPNYKEVPITINVASSNLGSSGQVNGTITVPVTSPVNTTLTISWSKVNTGKTGDNAIVFSLYAPDGIAFVNAADGATKRIQAQAYDGSTVIADSNATYKWYKYTGTGTTGWTQLSTTANKYTISGGTLTVYASEVESEASFKCVMTYNSKDYTDVITLLDKTDNFQLDIITSDGDVFKNTKGSTFLYSILWQNGEEVDAVKTYNFQEIAPSSASANDLCYVKSTASGANAHAVMLKKYSNGSWSDVTSQNPSTYTYSWYKRNANSAQLGEGTVFATGKVIFINGDDVDGKTIFTCKVE